MSVRERRSVEKSLLSPGSRRLFKVKTDRVRLLFIGFVLVADDFGRIEGDPEDVVAMFPRMGWTTKETAAAIKELEGVGLVSTYEVGTVKYLEVNNFEEHQDWHGVSGRGSKIPANPNRIATTKYDGRETPVATVAKFEEKTRPPHKEYAFETNTYTKKGTTTGGQSAADSFKQAKRIFRRYVGKSIGSLGNRGQQWQEMNDSHGSDKLLSAVEIWAQELGKGGRNLNWPLAVFFANADEFLEAAFIQKTETVSEQVSQSQIENMTEVENAKARKEFELRHAAVRAENEITEPMPLDQF